MERRILITLILYFLIFFFWYQWFISKSTHRTSISKSISKVSISQKKLPSKFKKGKEIYIETDLYKIIFDTYGARVTSLILKKYFNKEKKEIELIPQDKNYQSYSLGILEEFQEDFLNLTDYKYEGEEKIFLDKKNPEKSIEFKAFTSKGIEIKKRLRFYYNSYLIPLKVEFKNTTSKDFIMGEKISYSIIFGPGITSEEKQVLKKEQTKEAVIFINNKTLRKNIYRTLKKREYRGFGRWIGLKNKYFGVCLIPENEIESFYIHNFNHEENLQENEAIEIRMPLIYLKPNENIYHDFLIFAGPLDYNLLSSLKNKKGEKLELTNLIYLGWSGFKGISVIMLYTLKGIYAIVKNYGVAILLLTLISKIILFPITQMSLKSMKQMQRLQPQLQLLKEKYKNDHLKLNKEIMELYKKQRINPFSGCLPLFLQMPFFIALWGTLNYTLELRLAPFIFWIKDLSLPDTIFTLGKLNINILPLFMGLTTFWQQKITPTTASNIQESQTKFLSYFMPIFLTFIFWNFPSGLVLYWTFSNILTILQQKVIK